MKIGIFYNAHLLLLFMILICLDKDRFNCENTELEKLENCVELVYSSEKEAFVFKPRTRKMSNFKKRSPSSHNQLPWHVEKNMFGENIVPNYQYIIKGPFIRNNPKIYYERPKSNLNSQKVKRSFLSNSTDEIDGTVSSLPVFTPELSTILSINSIPTPLQSTEQFPMKDFNQILKSDKEATKPDLDNSDTLWRNLNSLFHDSGGDVGLPTPAPAPESTTQTTVHSSGQLNKEDCESVHHRNCICSFKQVVADFQNILSKNQQRKVQTVDIINYKCTEFLPIPESFSLSSDSKPKVLSKTKAMVIDDGKGPKEINQQSIEELLTYGLEDEGVIVYALPNTNLQLPCFPSEDVHLSPNTNDNTNFTWTHGNNKAITEGRITSDANHMGKLTIVELSLRDSDNYTCSVKYVNPDTGHYISEQFVHTVVVVSLPLIELQAVVHYKAALKCEESILEMFELYLPQQMERAVCDVGEGKCVCDINIHNPVCHTDQLDRHSRDLGYVGNNIFSSYWHRVKHQATEDSMEMSLNFEVKVCKVTELFPATKNSSYCNPICQQKVSLKFIQLVRETFPDLLPVKVTSNLGATFESMLHSVAVKYVAGCPGGYELSDGFCIPCKKNHFSEDGATSCSACPRGSYQTQIGSRSCIECKNHWMPTCNEFVDELDITVLVVVFSLVSVFVFGFGMVYILFLREPDKTVKETCVQTFTPCISPRVQKRPRVKIAKSSRYQKKRPVSEESEPLLTDDSNQPYEVYYETNEFHR